MKKYLLLVEDEKLWNRFKESIKKDINTEIMDLIRKKIGNGVKKGAESKKKVEVKKGNLKEND